jgi:hypothetical protein
MTTQAEHLKPRNASSDQRKRWRGISTNELLARILFQGDLAFRRKARNKSLDRPERAIDRIRYRTYSGCK